MSGPDLGEAKHLGEAKRELRRPRLLTMAYVGLSVLAAVTATAVAMALLR